MSPQTAESQESIAETPRPSPEQAFALVAEALGRNLALAQQVHTDGRTRIAADYVIGTLEELAPELAVLRAARTR
jgi:hypothetical protein